MRLGWGCSTLLYPRNLVSSGDYRQEYTRISIKQSPTPLGLLRHTEKTCEFFIFLGFQGGGGPGGLPQFVSIDFPTCYMIL